MANKGWIKLNREIAEHWIFEDGEKFKAWIDLIILANHENKKICMREGLVDVKKGQLVTSIGKLANRWNWSKDRVVRFLNLLEEDGMLRRKSDRFRTVLTIVNYGKYQDVPNTNKYTDKYTNKLSNKDTGKDTDKLQTRTIKNYKEIKEGELLSAEDDFVSEEEWQQRLLEQNEDW